MLVMLAIRLQRVGRKNDPSFRVIVTDSKMKTKTGNFLEILGSYNARRGAPVINTERAKHWLSVGAQPSGTVHNLLIDLKTLSGKKINVLGRKTPIVKEAPVVAEAPKVAVPVPAATPAPETPTETHIAEVAPEIVAEAPVEIVAESAPEVVETSAEALVETPIEAEETHKVVL